ncbi:unnamed protein product, partial [Rotaria socialis]
LLHYYVIPFIIGIIAAVIILVNSSRIKSTAKQQADNQVLKEQLIAFKHISYPRLKQMTMIVCHNCNNYESSIGKDGTRSDHFIDGSILERDILSCMPRLRQFNYHIRSILQNASHIKIRQSFFNQQEPFKCVLDHFKNKYEQISTV